MEDLMPLISVIVPVYKAEAYLAQCVDSILVQTYTNLELILVDDGSPDACPALCDAYAGTDPRVRVIHKPNGGVSSARNAGLDAAQGELVHFVDSDDWILPNMLQALYAAMRRYDADIACARDMGCYWCKADRNGGKALFLPSSQAIAAYWLERNMDILLGGPWAKLYRMDLVHAHSIRFPEDLSFCEDNFFNFAYYGLARRMVVLPDELYFYRILSDSLARRFRPDGLEIALRVHAAALAYFRPYGVPKARSRLNALYLTKVLMCCEQSMAQGLPRKKALGFLARAAAFPGVAEAAGDYKAQRGNTKGMFLLAPLLRNGRTEALYRWFRLKLAGKELLRRAKALAKG